MPFPNSLPTTCDGSHSAAAHPHIAFRVYSVGSGTAPDLIQQEEEETAILGLEVWLPGFFSSLDTQDRSGLLFLLYFASIHFKGLTIGPDGDELPR
jgi:hypothetical protein